MQNEKEEFLKFNKPLQMMTLILFEIKERRIEKTTQIRFD